jgi:dimethylglycine dehydrogenase
MTVDCGIASAHGGDPVFADGRQVGSVTSAGYGHRVDRNIAYAYIEPACAQVGTRLSLGILGERYDAEVVQPVLYDAGNRLPRS